MGIEGKTKGKAPVCALRGETTRVASKVVYWVFPDKPHGSKTWGDVGTGAKKTFRVFVRLWYPPLHPGLLEDQFPLDHLGAKGVRVSFGCAET